MKKLLMTAFLVIGIVSFAGVVSPFVQFTDADFCGPATEPHHMRPDQSWFGAQLITLDVHAGTGVWLSNYMSNWYGTEFANDGGNVALHGNRYDMSPKAYGYIFKDDIADLSVKKPDYDAAIQWSNGETTPITYYSDANENIKTTTTGYFLGYFEEDAEIYLVMTTIPADGHDTVDSYEYVQQDGVSDTSLLSRQHNTHDIAGNVRINFGIDSDEYGPIAREFVAVYVPGDEETIRRMLSGGPLPGVFFAGLLSLGTVFGASRLKKKRA